MDSKYTVQEQILMDLIFGDLLKIWIWQDFNLAKSNCHNNCTLASKLLGKLGLYVCVTIERHQY